MPTSRKPSTPPQEAALRKIALGYPETTEDFPWGHRALKVRGKVFVFMSNDEPELSLSVKLPSSAALALSFPFAEPTGYGMGKSGWVTARFKAKEKAPVDLLAAWIDESYRAIAPKRLVATLAGDNPPAATPKKKATRTKKRR